jgi:hypothetical protein
MPLQTRFTVNIRFSPLERNPAHAPGGKGGHGGWGGGAEGRGGCGYVVRFGLGLDLPSFLPAQVMLRIVDPLRRWLPERLVRPFPQGAHDYPTIIPHFTYVWERDWISPQGAHLVGGSPAIDQMRTPRAPAPLIGPWRSCALRLQALTHDALIARPKPQSDHT